jgi:hypothetical protein
MGTIPGIRGGKEHAKGDRGKNKIFICILKNLMWKFSKGEPGPKGDKVRYFNVL